MSLSEETSKCSEIDSYTLEFSSFNSIIVWFMPKKNHFV